LHGTMCNWPLPSDTKTWIMSGSSTRIDVCLDIRSKPMHNILLFVIAVLFAPALCQDAQACPPSIMPEMCPAAMLDQCNTNQDCTADQQCCQQGCFRKCISTSAPQPTPNQCSICKKWMQGNPECAADEYCCGCGITGTCRKTPCMERCAIGPCPPTQKPGSCPAVPQGLMCALVFDPNQCTNDDACPGDKKCCSNGCANACVDVAQPSPPAPTVKPGNCPVRRSDLACAMVFDPNSCRNDDACPGDQKCCSNGCSRYCVDVTETPALPTIKPGNCPVVDSRLACRPGRFNPSLARAEEDIFVDEAAADPNTGMPIESNPSSNMESDSIPNYAVALFVVFGILMVSLIVIQIQLCVVNRN